MGLCHAIRRTETITDPHEFFKGWTHGEFMIWLRTRNYDLEETIEDHKQSVRDTIKVLEKAELYELCYLADLYLRTL